MVSLRGLPAALRTPMGRFAVIFAVTLLSGFGLLLAPFFQPVVDRGTAGLVTASAFLIRVLGAQAIGQGDLLRNPSTGFSLQVLNTCNASNVTVLLWAAILAFPASWSAKVKGVVAGTFVIQALNLFRIVNLFYLGQSDARWFEFMHLYVWEGLFVLLTLTIFWAWVRGVLANRPVPARS